MKPITLFEHVNNSLNPYRWAISIVVAVVISVLFAAVSLVNRLDSDKQIVAALSPYLATLVEASDRPEMLRIVQSIAESKESDVIVTQDDLVIATSRGFDELDRLFQKPASNFSLFGHFISGSEVITLKEVRRPSHPSLEAYIYVLSPLLPSIQNTLTVFALTFISSILISFFSAAQMRKAIKKAIRPLGQLHGEIKGMTEENTSESNPIHIKELEEIRHTVSATKVDLENAKDRLAEVKAKKLSSDSYKRLIHDLHNPVAALRQMSKIANNDSLDEETKEEARNSIPRLVDQILNQVTSAKRNLEEEPVSLRELNVLDCVKESINQIMAVNAKKDISINCESDSLNVPHDPSLLKRAIINLLENGVEAAQTKVRVSILKNNENALIRICDDGPGMDENQIPLYLQGRGQSGKANRQAFGLSSTNHIVRSHGGKLIYRKSDLGGSSFEIRLGVV